jgi:hypothetical protein
MCDNASVNNMMIEELASLIDNFPGKANHTRCFLHILNLVAKSIIKLFDSPVNENGDNGVSDSEHMLAKLARGIELEELETRLNTNRNNTGKDDDEAGLHNEAVLLTKNEQAMFTESIAPVRLVIAKVSSFFKTEGIGHSPGFL